jgi:hypothetical protein
VMIICRGNSKHRLIYDPMCLEQVEGPGPNTKITQPK